MSFIRHPETPGRPWQEEARSRRLPGWGWARFIPCPGGERWEMPRNAPAPGTALPARPACGRGGSDPQPPTPPLTPDVLGSADSKSRANFCTQARLGSFSAAETPCPRCRSSGRSVHPSHACSPRAPVSRPRGQPAAGLRARGAKTHTRPRPSRHLGPNVAKRGVTVQLGPCFLQRGAELSHGRERSAGTPPGIYSGILSTAGSV